MSSSSGKNNPTLDRTYLELLGANSSESVGKYLSVPWCERNVVPKFGDVLRRPCECQLVFNQQIRAAPAAGIPFQCLAETHGPPTQAKLCVVNQRGTCNAPRSQQGLVTRAPSTARLPRIHWSLGHVHAGHLKMQPQARHNFLLQRPSRAFGPRGTAGRDL